jgi:hypothetical protein
MLMTRSKDERILDVYKIFKAAMSAQRTRVSIPSNVDPKKTYAWRYLSGFIDRCDKLDINDDMVHNTIYALVDHYKKSRQLHLGMAILNHRDLLGVCATKLEREVRDENSKIMSIRNSHSFLLTELSRMKYPLYKLLLMRSNPMAYTNITRWHQSNQLDARYIAISRTCIISIGTVPNI